MLYDSPHVRVEAADGVATLWLEFPGTPVNALTPPRLAEIDRALSAVQAYPHADILVVRSGLPGGFCGGYGAIVLETEAERTAFAVVGQRTLSRLAAVDLVTVAFLEGPCLGPGLELALACDHRLAVTGPDAWFGFPEAPPCWGGSARLGRRVVRELVTAREAKALGLVDDAICARRARIELRNFLDRLLAKPRKRPRPDLTEALARERAAFREAGPLVLGNGPVPCPLLPASIAVTGNGPLAVELAIRGAAVVADGAIRPLTEAVRRGRVTPLEAEQARQRIHAEGDADWVLVCGNGGVQIVKPRTPPADLVAWLGSLGFGVQSPTVRTLRVAA